MPAREGIEHLPRYGVVLVLPLQPTLEAQNYKLRGVSRGKLAMSLLAVQSVHEK
jgi:hypothetical protein